MSFIQQWGQFLARKFISGFVFKNWKKTNTVFNFPSYRVQMHATRFRMWLLPSLYQCGLWRWRWTGCVNSICYTLKSQMANINWPGIFYKGSNKFRRFGHLSFINLFFKKSNLGWRQQPLTEIFLNISKFWILMIQSTKR